MKSYQVVLTFNVNHASAKEVLADVTTYVEKMEEQDPSLVLIETTVAQLAETSE